MIAFLRSKRLNDSVMSREMNEQIRQYEPNFKKIMITNKFDKTAEKFFLRAQASNYTLLIPDLDSLDKWVWFIFI